MTTRYTNEGINAVATKLGVDLASVRAVIAVETNGAGFYEESPGVKVPKKLFERHVFYRLLKEGGKSGIAEDLYKKHPSICNPRAGGYNTIPKKILGMNYVSSKATQEERLRFAGTFARQESMEATSWGLPQIMGYHWKTLGLASLQVFINRMYKSEDEQLLLMAEFILKHPSMHRALKERNWAKFASLYNGPNYKINNYDVKLANAYKMNGGK